MKRTGFKAKRRPIFYIKPKVGSRRWLKARLDKLVSQITLQDQMPCFVCGCTDLSKVVCGHVMSRSFPATRFLLDNCVPLCCGCNLRHEHEPYHLIDRYISVYGRRAYDTLEAAHHSSTRATDSELVRQIEKLERLLNQSDLEVA